ncbi:hypothetical protein [Zymomonas mobilis]|uniref:HTH marR-type domain-containing protein n=1 Tax=Zymomonas mobilis subsp. pomaceae (strain ATCC 29192 / DSM 22645 / JCM 10191 / CCUG 17912 / NBRC 13757 / NCIMB 11200 / NRRL B-4491 / Barker I) TaxID=579138 RepID=F8ET71_ZYMMT|nr:hypothetical protein [Zymomonas mobilis]AEI36961.1 hypothetical protein Zymop_0057 [Zymomonas mobilis subsp. pomaceae ATCC 29192]MDX5948334.1 hypothetical protein [Zymomonas mobilis subsp. pomaceae]GEB89090.1 hypothetical protein ZMO02_07270 [Zymomonas mobilis subsp. pomaceae]
MMGIEKTTNISASLYNAEKSTSNLVYKNTSQILIVAFDPKRQALLEKSVLNLGLMSRIFPIYEAADMVANGMAGDAILLDLTSIKDESLAESLLDAVMTRISHDMIGVVINLPLSLIDNAYNRFFETDVQLLIESDESSWYSAIEKAIKTSPLTLNDVVADTRTPPLKTISEEVNRIAKMLASLSNEEGRNREYSLPQSLLGDERKNEIARPELKAETKKISINAAVVRAIIRAHRLRDQYFSSCLFADPAWDMLLDLTAAKLEGRQVSVSSLCIASAVPPTTALRWIKSLTEEKIFIRIADLRDGRRVFIQLSDMAMDAMIPYLAASLSLITRAL